MKYAPLDPLFVPVGEDKVVVVPEIFPPEVAEPVSVPELPLQYDIAEPASTVGNGLTVAVIAALLVGHPEEDA